MIILHASVLEHTVYLWSESHVIGDKDSLKTAMRAIDSEKVGYKCEKLYAWLPSRGETAIPSSPLVERSLDKRKKCRLLPHHIESRRLSLEELADFAGRVFDGPVAGSGVVYGPSLHWLAQLYKSALHLVAKERFIPGLVGMNHSRQARWIPVPDAADDEHLSILADHMPAVCRCLSGSSGVCPDIPSIKVSHNLFARLVDDLVRSSIGKAPDGSQVSSVHDAWLAALHNRDATIHWPDSKELQAFAKQLMDWSRTVDLNVRSPFRFCFRLSEPKDESGSWRMDYLLQPKTDQSTLIALQELWHKNSPHAAYLYKAGANPVEFALTALGQASGLCPLICSSLKQKNPTGVEMNAGEALQFLSDYAQPLQAAGFNVMLPSWWLGRGPVRRLGLKAKTTGSKSQSNSRFTLNTIMNFDYTASLGDEELSLEELKELSRLKEPLVKLRGQWTQIDQKEIQKAIRFLENHKEHSLQARDLLEIALGAEKSVDGQTLEQVHLDGWLKKLVDSLKGHKAFTPVSPPPAFKGILRPYQEQGYSWLSFLRQWKLGACLADDMGLGKTVQALALVQNEQERGEKRPVLLVCPTSVVNNWRKEAAKFTPELSVLIHHGTDRRKQNDFIKFAQKHAMVVSTYALLHRDIAFLSKVKWAGIVLDEAQNVKNPSTRQFKAARSLAADYRIALTGTPVENHVGDLWSIMEFLNPGMLGSLSWFQTRFKKPIQMFGDQQAAERLKTLTRPFILRRLKTDKTIIRDLPEKIEIKEYCSLTKEQALLYQAVVDDMSNQIQTAGGINRRGLVLAALIKLKQVCNHPAQFADDNSALAGRSGKLQRLTEMLLEIRELGERILIFSQFAEMGAMLQKYLQEYFGEVVYFLYGGTNKKKRDEMIDDFQNDAKAPAIFILSLKAGGTGLTLTRANHVFHYDRWWNPSVENQATDRAFRIGQTKDVQVHKFIVAGTLEERIDELIEHKTGIADKVVGSGEKWLSELSNKEFYELIKLDKESVGE